MPQVHFGGIEEPSAAFRPSAEHFVVRTHSRILRTAAPVEHQLDAMLADQRLAAGFPEANVGVYRLASGDADDLAALKARLAAFDEVRFVGEVLVDAAGEPIVYTENLFIKFRNGTGADRCLAALAEEALTVKRQVDYAANTFFVSADGRGQEVFAIAERLLQRAEVEYCHPEIVRQRAHKTIYPQQWHLDAATVGGETIEAHANVAAAHAVSTGEGVTIAIIDNGFDVDHPEFEGKIVHPRDVALGIDDARPKETLYQENHGTACAGVACARGAHGASGVAPGADLMPIRVPRGLASEREAQAFKWAVDHGADVISCSWGPRDSRWFDPGDRRRHVRVDMPASTRLAVEYALTHGRNGRGCVILFGSGNGNEPVEMDGYASHPGVIAVAACNDRGVRSCYSDYGAAVWCSFPSNDYYNPLEGRPRPRVPGIWTTDRRGWHGFNSGFPRAGDEAGHYTDAFGGTSSACPGAAGIAALILSVKPRLTYTEVRDVMKRACVPIDEQNGEYIDGWSPYYGWGRLDAARAVELAQAHAG